MSRNDAKAADASRDSPLAPAAARDHAPGCDGAGPGAAPDHRTVARSGRIAADAGPVRVAETPTGQSVPLAPAILALAFNAPPAPAALQAPATLMPWVEIVEGVTPALLPEVRQLLLEYAGSLGAEMSIQDVRHEARDLPGPYAAPRGCYLIARDRRDGAILGGVGLLPMPGPGDCESKRLHVREAGRGFGLGRRLGAEVIARARAMGYRRLVVEMHESMGSALRVYDDMGFEAIQHYYANPLPGTLYLALDLHRSGN